MVWGLVLLSCVVAIQGQGRYGAVPYPYAGPDYRQVRPDIYRPGLIDETPKPYSFQYDAPAIGGSSSRTETADGSGRVVGSYTLSDEDGRQRLVEYVADENGFTANVQTNEPGTKSESPANVVFNSAAPPPTYDVGPSVNRAVPYRYRQHADVIAPPPYNQLPQEYNRLRYRNPPVY